MTDGLEIYVWLNDGRGRRQVQARIVRSNPRTIWVRIADGNVIKRKRGRDLL